MEAQPVPTDVNEEARCPVCRALLAPDWDVAFMDADRRYFERHPTVSSYRRLPFDGEHPFASQCCGRLMVVEVVYVTPSVRTRIGYELLPDSRAQSRTVVQ